MNSQTVIASDTIHAPAEVIYEVIADYRTKHPLILPKPYFLSLEVEEGGIGEGTIVNFKMRVLGRTQSFRSLITEPVPGHTLLETDLHSGVSTRFHLSPLENGKHTRVTISTELQNQGLVERLIAKFLLQRIYHQELKRLAFLTNPHTGIVQSAAPDALTAESQQIS